MDLLSMSEQRRIYISRLILVFMLMMRFFGDYAFNLIIDEQAKVILQSFNLTLVFLLILLALWINKSRLNDLNFDRAAYVLLLIAILLLAWKFVPYFMGVILLAAVAALMAISRKETFQFSRPTLASSHSFILVILILLPLIPLILLSPNFSASLQSVAALQTALMNANFWGVYFEEFLFRGMLWDYLRSRSLKSSEIIITQALLFWLAHIPSMDKWIFFWIIVPFIGVMLGVLVHRSKSLAICVVVHFLYNCGVGLMKVGG